MPNPLRLMFLNALAAGVCLGGAAAFPFALGAVASQLMGFGTEPTPVQVGILLVMVTFVFIFGGGVWGVVLSNIVGAPEPRRMMWAGALSFGPATLAATLGLGALEPLAVDTFLTLPIHRIFTLLFVLAVFLVNAVMGLAFGVAMRDRKLTAPLALSAGIAGAFAFVAVNLILEALGWRVGAPDADERATMITVAMLSNLGAALNSGAMLGLMLKRHLTKPGALALTA